MWSDERLKVARRCGAKHISKSKCKNHTSLDHFWKLRCRKTARRCGVKHISKPNVQNTPASEHFWKLRCRKKCTPLWREAHFDVNMLKAPHVRATLDVEASFCVAGARDCAHCQKWAKRDGLVACPKTMAGVGHLKRICKDAFSVAGAVQETWSSELLGGPGADCDWLHFGASGLQFWEDDFAWQAQHFVWPGINFLWQAQCFRKVEWKKSQTALVRGRQLCTQPSIFEGSLAELFRFWCYQLRKLRKSRRLVLFLTLSSAKIEEVLQNCCVSKLTVRQTDRQTGRQAGRQTNR